MFKTVKYAKSHKFKKIYTQQTCLYFDCVYNNMKRICIKSDIKDAAA